AVRTVCDGSIQRDMSRYVIRRCFKRHLIEVPSLISAPSVHDDCWHLGKLPDQVQTVIFAAPILGINVADHGPQANDIGRRTPPIGLPATIYFHIDIPPPTVSLADFKLDLARQLPAIENRSDLDFARFRL